MSTSWQKVKLITEELQADQKDISLLAEMSGEKVLKSHPLNENHCGYQRETCCESGFHSLVSTMEDATLKGKHAIAVIEGTFDYAPFQKLCYASENGVALLC